MRQRIKKLNTITAPSLKTYTVATLTVLIACLVITFWAWNNAKQNLRNDLQTVLNTATDSVRDTISNTLNSYTEVLRGGAGLFNAYPDVTQDTWHRYIGSLDATNRYPGLQAVGYIQVVRSGELTTFLQDNPSPIGGQYNLQPDYARDVYTISRFFEPLTERNARAFGYDPFTEPIRRRAMEQARDSGAAAITARTTLIRDNEQPQPGFVVYLPVYRRDAAVATVTDRQAAIQGYISAGVRTRELIDKLFSKVITADSALLIYDGTDQKPDNLIYESKTYQSLKNKPGLTTTTQVFDAGTSKWTIVTLINQNVASAVQRKQPQEILIGGTVFSVLIAALLFIIMTTRARTIANEKNREVQEAKDSLISLASHQLRTPATGVKQFIGMVLEGYAGKVTKEQRQMLDKAYQSNERQLEIINQILHVTRADSGRLVLHKEKLDLNEIIKTVISEHSQPVKARDQKVMFKKGSPKMIISADRQYLTMAMDNLLSNASKYSHTKTTIRITTEQVGREVVIKVTDKGVGIHADDMHRLFQKFSRIDNELSVEAGGNGIGLYLCREVIALHGGDIAVESEPGKGSVFVVTLPKR